MKKYKINIIILITIIILSACTKHEATETQVPLAPEVTFEPTDIAIETQVSKTPDVSIKPTDTVEPTDAVEPTDIVEPTDVVEQTIDNFTEGVWIKKYPDNFACFKFESPEGYQIVSDPWNVYEKLKPDIVTESHQDLDHRDTTNLEPPFYLISQPGEYRKDDISIVGFAGKHNSGIFPGVNNIYIIKMNDITIAHLASQGELPSDDILEEIGTVDVLLIQIFVNPNYNKMLMKDADAIVKKLNPKIIIPEHGDENIGTQMAKHFNATEEVIDTGNIIVTRDLLDGIEGVRIMNLDNDNYEE